MDALATCGPALTVLQAVLGAATLAECGLRPCDVSLQWPRPPFRARMLLRMVSCTACDILCVCCL